MNQYAVYKRHLQEADGWMVRNLKRYHNTLCDSEVVSLLGVQTTEKLLSMIIDERVSIRGSNGSYIAEID